MPTLSSIRKQIASLEKKAQELIKREAAQAIAKARELIENYGLTAEDLGLSDKKNKRAVKDTPKRAGKRSMAGRKVAGKAMYRDPQTGKTWTGRGKPPAWIAGAADRSAYLIDGPDAVSASTQEAQAPARKVRAAKSAKARKASRKAASVAPSEKPARKAASSGAGRKKAAAKTAAPAKAVRGRKGAATGAPARKSSSRSAESSPAAQASASSPPASEA